MGEFWKKIRIFFKKDTPFFEKIPKEIHRIANFGSVSYKAPIKITYVSQVFLIAHPV